jgi:hypothetical protein
MLDWTIASIIAGATFTFGSGRIVESIRNGKYVKKEVCDLLHKDMELLRKLQDDRLNRIQQDVTQIRNILEK